MMRCRVLVENSAMEGLGSEWGLSFYIEHRGKIYLVDAGASGLFALNSEKVGADIAKVDAAVLSHAHYDHGLGMRRFFEINGTAPFYISDAAEENCYSKHIIIKKYIGLEKGILEEYSGRIVKCSGKTEIGEGVYCIPHYKMPAGGTKSMFVKKDGRMLQDTFRHEQSIVFVCEDGGLAVFSPCSHLGLTSIIGEVREQFPDCKVKAVAGGFHLFTKTGEFIENLAEELKKMNIGKFYTGHCTGARAYKILRERIGENVLALTGGMVIDL